MTTIDGPGATHHEDAAGLGHAVPPQLAHLPVAVIGAGPIGLAAGAHLAVRGVDFVVFEAGDGPGANVLDWGHVRLFSPWSQLIDVQAAELLGSEGWVPPPGDRLPTGAELVENYLRPLAAHPLVGPRIRYGSAVTSIHRRSHDKVKSRTRALDPLVVRVRDGDGDHRHLVAAAIDASGTWTTPNPTGAGGVAGAGERALASMISYRIPDVLDAERPAFADRHTVVVGSGHSAVNALLDLVELARSAPGTKVTWAVRGSDPGRAYGIGDADELPARGSLGERIRAAVDAGTVDVATGFAVEDVEAAVDGRLDVAAVDGRRLTVDRVVALTGQRPDLEMTRELRLDLDSWLEAPRRLAPLIDPNVHTCGTVEPHGHETLAHPEPGYFTVGIKSYGRAPTFLTRTGYEQVRSVIAALTGSSAGAERRELSLAGTGRADLQSAEHPQPACCI